MKCSLHVVFNVSLMSWIMLLSLLFSEFTELDSLNPNAAAEQTGLKPDLSLQKRTKFRYRWNLRKQIIRNAQKLNSSCLDGSDAVFYLGRNSESPNWVIRLQAGGSCVSLQECVARKQTPFGSSKYLNNAITGTFLASDDPSQNPTFHKWNKVFIPYCSGDLFVGRRRAENHIYNLHMLGHYIVTSVIKQLIQDYYINSRNTTILFGGASAGGVGMLANIDHIAELVKPAKMLGYNDGGWFTLYPNYKEPVGQRPPEFLKTLRTMFDYFWDGFVDESCRAEMRKPAACLYGEMAIRYLSTPIYVMVSQWDSYQLKELIHQKYHAVHLPPSSHHEKLYLVKFGNNTHRSIRKLIASERSGVFSPACVSHTFAGVNETEAIITMEYKISNVTPYKALSEWYQSQGKMGTYVEVPLKSPRCNPTCCSKFCSDCRKLEEKIEILGPREVKTNFPPSGWATRRSLTTVLLLLPLLSVTAL